jgi:hypothetical protein
MQDRGALFISHGGTWSAQPEHHVCCESVRGVPQVAPERKKSPEAVAPSCARSERANTGYGHQEGVAVGRAGPTMSPSCWSGRTWTSGEDSSTSGSRSGRGMSPCPRVGVTGGCP